MKKTLALFALVALAVAVVVLTTVQGQNSNGKYRRMRADKRIANQYIVVLKDDVADVEGEAIRLARDFGGDRNGGHTYNRAIKGFSVRMPEQQAARLADEPRVAYVEEDGVVSLVATQTGATWGLDRIDQRDLPLNQTYNFDATGSGVRAYIIDTGIRATHAEFGGRVVSGFTAINDGLGTNDGNGHGTHVAGTVGGSTFGVAKNVTLVAVRVLDSSGNGTNSGVIAGVDFVTADHGAINCKQRDAEFLDQDHHRRDDNYNRVRHVASTSSKFKQHGAVDSRDLLELEPFDWLRVEDVRSDRV